MTETVYILDVVDINANGKLNRGGDGDMTDMADYVENEEEEYTSVGEMELDDFTSDDGNEDEYDEYTTIENIENVASVWPLRTVYENDVQQTNRLRINHLMVKTSVQ